MTLRTPTQVFREVRRYRHSRRKTAMAIFRAGRRWALDLMAALGENERRHAAFMAALSRR